MKNQNKGYMYIYATLLLNITLVYIKLNIYYVLYYQVVVVGEGGGGMGK